MSFLKCVRRHVAVFFGMSLTSVLFGAASLALLLPASALAQSPSPQPFYGNRVLSMALLKPHLDDVRQMLIDLNSINTPQMASFYEAALNQRMPAIMQNQQRVRDAMPSIEIAKRDGSTQPDMRQAVQTLMQMNEQLFPKISIQMERVEKLNPNLKRHFDAVRSFKY